MTELRTPGLGTRGSGLEEPTDAALDREIEQALSVSPSPDFVARVRTRVAGDVPQRRPNWLRGWGFAAAGAVAAVAVFAIYLGLSGRISGSGVPAAVASDRPAPREIPRGAALDDTRSGAADVAQTSKAVVEPRRRPSAAIVARGRAEAGGDRFPEVMVSASELTALRQLLAMGQAGISIDAEPDAGGVDGTEVMPGIVIEPITIDPIVLARTEGAAE